MRFGFGRFHYNKVVGGFLDGRARVSRMASGIHFGASLKNLIGFRLPVFYKFFTFVPEWLAVFACCRKASAGRCKTGVCSVGDMGGDASGILSCEPWRRSGVLDTAARHAGRDVDSHGGCCRRTGGMRVRPGAPSGDRNSGEYDKREIEMRPVSVTVL